MLLLKRLGVAALLLAPAACSDDVPPGVTARMNLDGAFFDAPFPSAHRDRGDGSIDVSDFPADGNPLIEQMITLLDEGATGYSGNAAIYFTFDGPIAVDRLPETLEDSMDPASPVQLVNVDPESDHYGERIPVEVAFKASAETHTPANLLALLPFPGIVLEPNTTYAAFVRRALGDQAGRALFRSELLDELLNDDPIAGPHAEAMSEAFGAFNAWRREVGSPSITDIAAATVFTTGDPLEQMRLLYAQARTTSPEPATEIAAVETFDDYCVVSARVALPVYQRGPKPYEAFPDGQLAVDDGGRLEEQARDEVEVVFTIPHGTMPDTGFPIVLYAAGAEGKARQVIDRTAIDADPDEGLGPAGEGPAKHYAMRGIAAFGFPAPLTWERHPDDTGGLLDFWNVANLGTFRDVLRQGVLDFATLVPLMATVQIDETMCPEATTATGTFQFDPDQIYVHGHSTGATIGGAVIALDAELKAGIMSGAGGSWIYNVALAESPFDLSGIAHLLLDYDPDDTVDIFDPALTLFQHTLESVEVMSWGRATIHHTLSGVPAKQLLHIEGVVDTYHFPRMANAYSMALGIDLVEPEAEDSAAVDLALVGREVIPAPATGNIDGSPDFTAAVIQREQNHQDGHYVPFEFDDVKYRYACFIATAVENGTATVAAPNDDAAAPCP